MPNTNTSIKKVIDGQLDWLKISLNTWRLLFNIQLKPNQKKFVPSPLALYRMMIFSEKKDDATFDIFVVRLGGNPIGVFTLLFTHDNLAWLGGFQIDYHYQGMGIASLVMESIYQCLLDLNGQVTSVRLNVHKDNTHAVDFYIRNGFTIDDSDGEDNWIMRRAL